VLASALSVLSRTAEQRDPQRMAAVVDRIGSRVLDLDDLFTFCPSHGDFVGDGTIWSLICTSSSVISGVLIRRFFVEYLGGEFEIDERHEDAVLFALDEFPENLALFEIVSRCPRLRATYGNRHDGLSRSTQALTTLRAIVLSSPLLPSVGTTSAIYGESGDAFFTEPELFRALLEVLLSPEGSKLIHLAATAGPQRVALQEACLLVADICSQLRSHSLIVARALVFLAGAMPWAFRQDAPQENEILWKMLHVFVSSSGFVEVLDVCSASRMHDAGDLRTIRFKLCGNIGEDDRRPGLVLADVRLVLCHVLFLLFNMLLLMHHQENVPPRFIWLVADVFRERWLSRLESGIHSPLAGRWPAIRVALRALREAAQEAPHPCQGLFEARRALHDFATERFLSSEGPLEIPADKLLDPLGGLTLQRQRAPGDCTPMNTLKTHSMVDVESPAPETPLEIPRGASPLPVVPVSTAALRRYKGPELGGPTKAPTARAFRIVGQSSLTRSHTLVRPGLASTLPGSFFDVRTAEFVA